MSQILNVPDDSYVTLEDADSYHFNRVSFAEWNALDEETKSRRLVSASDYLDHHYRFVGEKAEPTQLRAFPRKTFEELGIPQAIKYAVCELALNADLNQNPEQKMASVKVGPISVNYKDEEQAIHIPKRYEYVGRLLSVWLVSSKGTVNMLRG